ncbi:MAG: DUF2950 family protein [Planctomycetota bacterium]
MLRQSGFTLMELMIVTAIVGILAGVAVPTLIGSRAVANERAVLATMRTIATAQAQIMGSRSLDADHDGMGEAIGLLELAGAADLRGTTVRLSPTGLTHALGTADANGYVPYKGYLLALYLPDASGLGVLAVPANNGSIDTDQAELGWSCLAWPVRRGNSGTATFFVNHTGEVLACRDATYSGTTSVPPPGAGLVGVAATQILGGEPAADTIGADGNLWRTLR